MKACGYLSGALVLWDPKEYANRAVHHLQTRHCIAYERIFEPVQVYHNLPFRSCPVLSGSTRTTIEPPHVASFMEATSFKHCDPSRERSHGLATGNTLEY